MVFLTQCKVTVSDAAFACHQGTHQLQAALHCMPPELCVCCVSVFVCTHFFCAALVLYAHVAVSCCVYITILLMVVYKGKFISLNWTKFLNCLWDLLRKCVWRRKALKGG